MYHFVQDDRAYLKIQQPPNEVAKLFQHLATGESEFVQITVTIPDFNGTWVLRDLAPSLYMCVCSPLPPPSLSYNTLILSVSGSV